MVRLGKVHGNRMVDVNTRANVKLVDRGERILMDLTGLDRSGAAALLAAAEGQVKPAAVMHTLGVDLEEAQRQLKESGGFLRPLLEPDQS